LPECPICASPVQRPSETIDWSGYDCPRCGRWSVRLDAGSFELWSAREIGEWDTPEAVRRRSSLSHIFRRLQPVTPPSRWAEVPVENWRAKFLDNEPLPTPAQLLDNLILWIGAHQASIVESAGISVAALSAWIGATITRYSPKAALGWLLETESAQALIEDIGEANGQIRLRLKIAGWDRYELLKRGQVTSRKVLMAMKFKSDKFKDEQLDALVQRFTEAVAQTGFDLSTIESGPAGSIDDQLRVALRTSRFIIADLTHGNQGAYWEAGYAEGLGRPVIYTCRQKEWREQGAHFDVNHLRTIIWKPDDLDGAANKLKNMIRVTLPEDATMID
jgi:nucleoside 2-deoxyribosyltransferase